MTRTTPLPNLDPLLAGRQRAPVPPHKDMLIFVNRVLALFKTVVTREINNPTF
jgi:hypothetical protein